MPLSLIDEKRTRSGKFASATRQHGLAPDLALRIQHRLVETVEDSMNSTYVIDDRIRSLSYALIN